MTHEDVLNNLQKRNDSLKSKLLREQLKYNNFTLTYYEKYSQMIINEYKQQKSLFKSAETIGIEYENVLHWFTQGQLGNPNFQEFYISITQINNESDENSIDLKSEPAQEFSNETALEGDYIISQYGDGWSYKAFINGEKIFIISNELETLKEKVKAKRLPLD